MTGIVPRPDGGMVAGMQVPEAAIAVAVASRAEIESRYLMALQRPRDWPVARQKILDLCAEPIFAEQALYAKPVGDKEVTGLSIRFVEAALQLAGNMYLTTSAIFEDDERRIMRVVASDLEANTTYTTDVVIKKVVERSRLAPGQRPIAERINSRGRKTYLVIASDDEVQTKGANLVSKAIRTNGLRLLPADLLEQAEQAIRKAATKQAAAPNATDRVLAAFASLGIDRAQLEGYIERPITQATPTQIADLRAIYTGLKEGELSWADLQAAHAAPPAAEAEQAKHPIADATEPYGAATPRATGAISSTVVESAPPPASPTPTEDITAAQPELSGLPPSPVRKRGKSNYEEGA